MYNLQTAQSDFYINLNNSYIVLCYLWRYKQNLCIDGCCSTAWVSVCDLHMYFLHSWQVDLVLQPCVFTNTNVSGSVCVCVHLCVNMKIFTHLSCAASEHTLQYSEGPCFI